MKGYGMKFLLNLTATSLVFFATCEYCLAQNKDLQKQPTVVKSIPKFDVVHQNFKPIEPDCLASKENFAIKNFPFIQHPDQDSVVVSWHTNKPAVSWVEIAPDDNTSFYAKERQKFFDAPLGRKTISKVHNIKITGLQKGVNYRYRVFSKEVKALSGQAIEYGQIASTKAYKINLPILKTLDDEKTEIKFCVLNDMHQNSNKVKNLLSRVEGYDFILLNGDMTSSAMSVEEYYSTFLGEISNATNGSVPVYFLRGNHETRGIDAQDILKVFPTPSGTPYYAFKYGEFFFIAIDSGEDKPDSDIEYFDNNDFDSFRTREAKWLEGVVNSKEYNESKVRIAFMHMPIGGALDKDAWHGEIDAQKKFAPILNNRGIDLLLSGHIHEFVNYNSGSNGLDFANVVNSSEEIMEVTISKTQIKLRTINQSGEILHECTYKPKQSK